MEVIGSYLIFFVGWFIYAGIQMHMENKAKKKAADEKALRTKPISPYSANSKLTTF
jgi:hypothetical protein